MVFSGIQAWVTAAVEEKAVDKALVLAASLRDVKTTKKLVTFVALGIPEEKREKLENTFDHVFLLDKTTSNGLNLEDYAKIKCFSLVGFTKCVYLSPSSLVLKNCDEIFETTGNFATLENVNNIFVYTPSLNLSRALAKVSHHNNGGMWESMQDNFSHSLNRWLRNNIPKLEVLNKKYALQINLDDAKLKSLEVDASISNFNGKHPLDVYSGNCTSSTSHLGPIEKFVFERCLHLWLENAKDKSLSFDFPENTEHYSIEPIAIVGMSFRLPGGNDVDEFWDLLINGKEAIQSVPRFRWNPEHTLWPCKNRNYQAGFLNVPIDEFDAKFFGISPKDAVYLDPQQRLLHEISWEAFEDAMIDPHSVRGTQASVFVGSWIHDYKDIVANSPEVEYFRSYMGNSIATEAARLSHFLGVTGPSIATESGCSSAIVALHLACNSLRNNETNLSLVCGVNIMVYPQDKGAMEQIVAPDGRCKTFSEEANGFGRAEGCAVMVLKRYSDAIKDGDRVWGLVRGSAVTQEGLSRSLGTPTVHCESLAMKLALSEANVNPLDVTYVESHGTGTAVGDPMEMAAIAVAYGEQKRNDPLLIGSVKTNVGHTESVSGLTGIIKVLLSMKHEMVPPHLNLTTLNPKIDLSIIPAEIPLSPTPWPKHHSKPRIAGVNSFGISGTDGHAIIQEPPIVPPAGVDFKQERPLHVIKFSAKCRESLDKLLDKYETVFSEKAKDNDDQHEFANVAYSANTGRATFNHRAILKASSFSEAEKILKEKSFKQGEVQGNMGKLCFLFTGQGSQYPNMAATLYETSPVFKIHFDNCSDLLQDRYRISLKDVLWGNANDNGKMLDRTLYSQTSIFCVEFCLLKLWESWGVKPDYVLGHSLGEFAAAVAANIISFEDALMLVAERSRLIDNLPEGKMLVIKAGRKAVEKTMEDFRKLWPQFWVDFAAINSPDQTVVAGETKWVEEFSQFCKEKQLKSIILASTHAFHSRLMDSMLGAYGTMANTVRNVTRNEDAPLFVSGLEGKIIDPENVDAAYWVRHTREHVRFTDACDVIQAEGCKLFLEVGPHPILSAFVMMNNSGSSVTCLPSIRRKENEWTTLLDSLSRLYLSDWKNEINWKGFDRFYPRERVSIPFYQFDRKSAWIKHRPESGLLHPLLGSVIQNASSTSLYEQVLTLKRVSYCHDHVVGNTILLPGAGFLEMCLSGGHSCAQGFRDNFALPTRPVGVTDLKIKSPLALADSQHCVLQTVVSLENGKEDDMISYNVTVHRLNDSDCSGSGQWIEHTSAKFLPMVAALPEEVLPLNIPDFQQNNQQVASKEFYEKLPDVGLRFGPKFQSLQTGWKTDSGVLLQVKSLETKDTSLYSIHPVVIDAMIQSIMLWTSLSKNQVIRKLQLPISVREFIWLDSSDTTGRYIYCSNGMVGGGASSDPYCMLLDDEGKPLAYMRGVEFAETTVKVVEGMIHQQSATLPLLWKEVLKPVIGPTTKRFDFAPMSDPISPELLKQLASFNKLDEGESSFYQTLCEMAHYYFLHALYKLGWCPTPGQVIHLNDLRKSLGIAEQHYEYFGFFINILEDMKFLEKKKVCDGTTEYTISTQLPNATQVTSQIADFRNSRFSDHSNFILMRSVGENLADSLVGKFNPMTLLFPTDPSAPSVKKFYESYQPFAHYILKGLYTEYVFPHIRSSIAQSLGDGGSSGEKPVVRILEVGAGTGIFTWAMLNFFDATGFDFEYHYTDLSAAFFGPAEKMMAKSKFGKHFVYSKFDMEKDPMTQGYSPHYFDLIFACEAIHIGRDPRATLRNLRTLLRPNGCINFYETVKQCRRITFLFGLLDGYWQFGKDDLRSDHIAMSNDMWTKALEESGYTNVTCHPVYDSVHSLIMAQSASEVEIKSRIGEILPERDTWIVLADESQFTTGMTQKLKTVNRQVIIVTRPETISEEGIKSLIQNLLDGLDGGKRLEGVLYLWGTSETRDQTQISLPFVSLCQSLITLEKLPRVVVVTQGVYPVDDSEVINPANGTLPGMTKTMRNENVAFKTFFVDLSPKIAKEEQVDEVFYNLWPENNGVLIFDDRKHLIPQIVSMKPVDQQLSLPKGCDRYQLVLPKSLLIADLEFSYLDPYVLNEKEIEVQTKAMALNFRDVFAVIKPLPIFDELNSVGLDYSGIVSRVGPGVTKFKVGDRVFGMNTSDDLSLPSHLPVEEARVLHLPDRLTFAEGATVPAVYLTVFLSLVDIRKLTRDDTILIHTASGGVGCAAIQVAKHIGATIIATAGSIRKRNFLRNLGIQHVFNSRTTDFGKEILAVTNNKGVDIVLNSITGPGFKEASLECLAENGWFLEMSKLSVWSKEDVQKLRPDVSYEIVDLRSVPRDVCLNLTNMLTNCVDANVYHPVPYDRFDALNIREALGYLQKAKHIGKIVCIMPEVKVDGSKLLTNTPLFNDQSTYIVTGGLGGIGFEVVKWMLQKGAKHIAIVSRRQPSPEIAGQLEVWNNMGKHVEAFAVDVGDHDQCRQLFNKLEDNDSGFPQIRGVMHAAGVLSDAILENQSWSSYRHTYNPKVNGSWNLHDLTRHMPLEHFVLFSSIAASLGSIGQTNHSASNYFEDTLASFRRSIGLPATSVNWGNWGEVGVAVEVDIPGLRPISTKQGLAALELFLTTQKSHYTVANLESLGLFAKLYPNIKGYIADKKLLGETKLHSTTINSDEFWGNVDAQTEREGKVEIFKEFIKSTVKFTLQLNVDDEVGDETDFQELGIDSLMMLEMKNGLQNVLGTRMTLTAAQLKDCNNTQVLADKLVDILEGDGDAAMVLPTLEQLHDLVMEDCILPENISASNENLLPAKDLAGIKTVLLTGSTGNLGPYILRDLSQMPQINKIICIIRKSGKHSDVSDKLRARLHHTNVLSDVDMNKVKCIQGDVTDGQFRLTEKEYCNLAAEVDAVFHSAVLADHTAKYGKSTNKNHVRTVNVIGTTNLLEFTTHTKLKHFYHASTLLAVASSNEEGCLSEDWLDHRPLEVLLKYNPGYILSKYIAEQLMKRACERGIPVKVFRFPGIAGDSRTGRCDYETNHLVLRWLAYMKLGCMPDIPTPFVYLPVDHCSSLSLEIFFNSEANADIYNVCSRHVSAEQTLVEVARDFGITVEMVPFQEYMKKLKEEDPESPLAPFKQLYEDEMSMYVERLESFTESQYLDYANNSEDYFKSRKLLKLYPDYERKLELLQVIMKRDLEHLQSCGAFKKFGINL